MRKKEVLERPARRKYSICVAYISEVKAEKENQENEINFKLPGLNFEKLLSTKGLKILFLVRQNTILVLKHSLTNISLNCVFHLVLYHGLQK